MPEDTTTTPATSTPATPAAPAAFDWGTAGLTPEHQSLVTERGWKSPGDVMTSYRHLEKATGVPPERLIKLPAEGKWTPEIENEVYTKLGRPVSADKYVIPVPEGDKGEFAKTVAPWLFEAGLSQSQATKLATKWNEHVTSLTKAAQVEADNKRLESVNELKKAWGSEYDANAAIVDRAAEAFGMTQAQLDGLKQAMGVKGAMEFLYAIGTKVAVEPTTAPGIQGHGKEGGFGAMTPAQAQEKIRQLKQDPSFSKLFSSTDPKQRQEARAEMDRLTKIAYPGSTPVANVSVS